MLNYRSTPRQVRFTYGLFVRRGGMPGILEEASRMAMWEATTTILIEGIPPEKRDAVCRGVQFFFGLHNPRMNDHEIEFVDVEWDFPRLDTLLVHIKVKS